MLDFTMMRPAVRALKTLCALLLIATILMIFAAAANATTTFTSSVTTANGQLTTVLNWSSTQSQCTASGSPDWMGPVASTGSLSLPTISLSGTYTLTLTCTTPQGATLTWTNPTLNTDGTPYNNPAGVRIVYGTDPQNPSEIADVANPTATTTTVNGLAAGTWYFRIKAYNTQNVESALSNQASKVVPAAATDTESVTLTVNPIPQVPTNLTAN